MANPRDRIRGESDSGEHYRLIAENASDVIAHVDGDGVIAWVSPAVEAAFGAPPAHWIGMSARALVLPGDHSEADASLSRIVKGGIEVDRVRVLAADGTVHWTEFHAQKISDPAGNHDGYIAIFRVVDDEVALEQARDQVRAQQAEAYAQLRAASDAALDPQAIVEVVQDPAGEVVDLVYRDVNRAFCEYVGLTREQQVGQSLLDTFPGVDGAGLLARYAHCAQTGEPVILDAFPYFNELLGRICYYDIRGTRIRPGLIFLAFRDATDRIAAEQARRDQAKADSLYRRSMESSAVGMCLASPKGPFVEVNQALCDFFGYDEETLLRKTWVELTAPEYLQADLDNVADMVAGRIESYRMIKQFIHADGHRIWGDLAVGCLRGADGGVELSIGQIVDITEQVESRQEQAEADARFRRVMENSNVAMSLNTPDGRFEVVNEAMCEFLGYDADTLRTKTWQDLTPPEFLNVDNYRALLSGRVDTHRVTKQFVHADGHRVWGDVSVGCLRDSAGAVQSLIGQVVDITEQVEARERQAEADARFRRLMENSNVGMSLTTPDGRFEVVNQAMCDFFGYDADTLRTKTWQDLTPAEYMDADLENVEALVAGRLDNYRVTKQFIHADGHRIWGEVSAGCLRDSTGAVQSLIGQIIDITEQVESRERQAEADARFRNLMEHSSVGISMSTLDGRVAMANQALCDLFGFDAETVLTKTWQGQTPAHHLAGNQRIVEDLVADRIQAYRDVQQFIHADGHLFWGDISAFCLRNSRGEPEFLVAQIIDITERVEAEQRLQSELEGAAAYVASILPGDLDGPVRVSSRFLPSREVGGDCFDFAWLDEDHLMVYLLDVSGHGAEPAMLAVSARNLMKSGTSFVPDVFREPDQVLTFMNRFHRMEEHGNHYLTMWYGVYQKSTRTLRYASAGHPPALALSPGGRVTRLSTPATPVGMFADAVFVSAAYQVSAGDQILVFSDGVFDFPSDGETDWGYDEFVGLCTELAAQPDCSPDTVIAQVRTVSGDGHFDDDCSLVRLSFD